MDDVVAACGPQIADSILKLSKSCADEAEFLSKCALFARVDEQILKRVFDARQPATTGSQHQAVSEHPAKTPEASLDEQPTGLDVQDDRDWYCDEPVLQPEPVHIPKFKPDSQQEDRKVHVFYREPKPPFIKTTGAASTSLVSVVREPAGNLARQAKSGSETVKQFKIQREKRSQARDATHSRGMLSSLDTQAARDAASKPSMEVHNDLVKRELPANQHKSDLLQAVKDNQVLIVVGETGSGKTTQIPQFLAELGYTVACTQPRRVAAMSVADRVAAELSVPLGTTVGYSIRFEDKTSPQTKIKFLTDGILLREAQSDPLLEKYDCIIIDEAHERALNTDILLGLFKRILPKRLDLKVIITSATINATLFSEFYGHAPIYTIPGRSFPVQIQNLKAPILDYVQAAVKQTLSIHLQMGKGDILVFMTGQDDIEATCFELEEKLKQLDSPPALEILPIYSQLPQDLQARIFSPSKHRKVIVATNIAETSLTIEGIKFVVDTGLTKVKVHQPKYSVDILQLVPISKANASQRAGRAGRTSEGFAFRLYTKFAEFDEMFEQPVPELARSNLANTLLFLKVLGVDDPNDFDFLDRPEQSSIDASLRDLWVIGALDSQGSLTRLGKRLSKYPLDPLMSRMLVASIDAGCSEQMLTIVAMMCVPPVFVRSNLRGKESDQQREKFQVPQSDHLTLLNVYNEWLRNNRSKAWCKSNFLQYKSLLHAHDVRSQLAKMVREEPVEGSRAAASDHITIRRCICEATFYQASKAKGLQTFVGMSSGVELSLHPTSSLYGLGNIPSYVVYNEVILTSRQYMMLVTEVEAEWLLEFGSTIYAQDSDERVVLAEAPAREGSQSPPPRPRFKRQRGASIKPNKNLMRGI